MPPSLNEVPPASLDSHQSRKCRDRRTGYPNRAFGTTLALVRCGTQSVMVVLDGMALVIRVELQQVEKF